MTRLLALGVMWLLAMVPATANPLQVVLIPADGGTESGTKADYAPIFNAISRATGLAFDLSVAQSYGAVVEAMCSGTADIAFVGPVTFVQAEKRGCAELLAVAVKNGKSVYYSGLFVPAASPVRNIKGLRGRRIAFGDMNSTSSFIIPIAMLLEAGIDPARDLAAVRLTGSHVNSLAALAQGQVDAAALSFESYEKAVSQGMVVPHAFRLVARSAAMPNPPLVMNSRLPPALKARLRAVLGDIAHAPGATPDMIRGYGGGRVDGYDTHFAASRFSGIFAKMAMIDDELKGRILVKASAR